ncbi:SGNH/GDSL hydrolase family protein [Bosea sp. PAMC 26642]|uniref:SGNH/GDSL hydrolase family protein n=1 Tax=Bosea sp. (strain PAMC 26642) TaxID=1792307 RepID=UPI0007704C6A|nr:hypothetical protein [Bosea sp. PAMC 26642]AMJ60505.1 hypothetical protein AXW83_09580 [Bosea sp. PAMC 26642]
MSRPGRPSRLLAIARVRPRLATAVVLLLMAGAGAVFLMLDGLDRGRYGHLIAPGRIAALKTEVAAAQGAVVFLGDSHATFLGETPSFCGRRTVNAALGGISAAGYLALLGEIGTPPRAAMGILSIGTNSARRKLLPRSVQAFRTNAQALIAALSPVTERLFILAVPPVAAEEIATFDRAALAGYSRSLSELCHAPGCRFLDPYAGLRSATDPVVAKPGATVADGVHLADYAAMRGAVSNAVCP